MNYGIVGTGYWGKNHVRVASELAADGVLDDVVVCDVDRERAVELAERFDLDYCTDYRDVDVDAASLATPSTTHEQIATDLLASGTDLLVEKPLALDADAAWNIVETAEEYDRTLGVGHIFRYHPALTELKQWIDDGKLGEIKYLHTARFAFEVPRETTGVLYSLAVHDVDIYNYLLDRQPTRVYCNRDSHLRDGIDETATVELEYGDTRGVIHSSWQIPVFGKRRDLAVIGTDAAAYVDYPSDTEIELYETSVADLGDGQLELRNDGPTVHEMPEREPLKAEIQSFIDATAANRDPLASGTIGAQTVEILERAKHSDESDEVLSLSPTNSLTTRTS
ncbi:Gfo/Idh/MocA family protein [Halorientalis brevis]|uniref:Gfo/Idh/MocA family protein n=1 Tax=Halorientalis brevis TaxID=1126241 RepID=A0ABD6CDW7_9EURY|nr:Gfo/Idh/MocA family oxidoreductase [Halorientalis brevis]